MTFDEKLKVIKITFDIINDIKKRREAELDEIIKRGKEILAMLDSVGKQKTSEAFFILINLL